MVIRSNYPPKNTPNNGKLPTFATIKIEKMGDKKAATRAGLAAGSIRPQNVC